MAQGLFRKTARRAYPIPSCVKPPVCLFRCDCRGLLAVRILVTVWCRKRPVAIDLTPAAVVSFPPAAPGLPAFVDGVTAAAIGAIAGACVVLGRRTIFPDGWAAEFPKVGILLVTIGLLVWLKKLPEPVIVLGTALIGLVIYPFVRT